MDLYHNLIDYFNKLGFQVPNMSPADAAGVPFFVRNTYHFYQITFGSKPCLFCLFSSTNQSEFTPGEILNHYKLISKQTSGVVVLVFSAISSHNRKRFIQKGISFIVPGTQLFIPDLAMDLREYFPADKPKREILSPAAQLTLLFVLNRHISLPLTPTELANETGYSRMSMTRAINELNALELCQVTKTGRMRNVHFPEIKRELWEQTLPFLRSPVVDEIWTKALPMISEVHLKYGGLTALSHATMIQQPNKETFAVDKTIWQQGMKKALKLETDYPEEAHYKVELWMYDPALLSDTDNIDSLSLFLSLQSSQDERVEAALDQLIKEFAW